jgi:hypothetical protein
LNNHIWSADERISTEEEIKNSIDQRENNKAAGPDGIPAEFYKE